MSDEMILSQADIDAMLAKEMAISPKPKAVIPNQQTVLKDVPKITSKIPTAQGKVEMTQSASQVAQSAQHRAVPSNEVELLRAMVTDLTNRLTAIETTMAKSRGNFDYSINKMFRCNSCDSQGLVSFNVRCTKCGEQHWWGWWPKK